MLLGLHYTIGIQTVHWKKKAHLFKWGWEWNQPRTKGHFKVKDDCFRRWNHSWIQLLRRGKIIISAKITLWYACKDNKWYAEGFGQRYNDSVLHPAKPKIVLKKSHLSSLKISLSSYSECNWKWKVDLVPAVSKAEKTCKRCLGWWSVAWDEWQCCVWGPQNMAALQAPYLLPAGCSKYSIHNRDAQTLECF